MTVKHLKLSNMIIENRNHFQCHHNNTGYCKFKEQCQYQHFSEICNETICKENKCRKRHPKPCRNGASCKFNRVNKCAFKHNDENNTKTLNVSAEIKYFEETIKDLKLDIENLKKSIYEKEIEVKEHKVKISNVSFLKDQIENENVDIKHQNYLLKLENEALKQELEEKRSLQTMITTDLSRSDLDCEECQFKAKSKTKLKTHKTDPKTQTKISDSKQTFPCGKCCLQFPNKESLKIHKNEMDKTVLKF